MPAIVGRELAEQIMWERNDRAYLSPFNEGSFKMVFGFYGVLVT